MMTTVTLDEPHELNGTERFDIDKLEGFLKNRIPDLQGKMRVRQFPGGASNLTFSLLFDNQDLVLRRPPFGKIPRSGHDMWREYRIQRDIKPVFPAVPEVLLFCDDPDVMGCDFYVMKRIHGVILRKDLPEYSQLNPDTVQALCRNVVDKLIEIHTCDYRSAGLEDIGKPEGYVERQVEGWIKRYRDAATPDAPTFNKVLPWLTRNLPPQQGAALVHGDFRFDNCIMNPDCITEVVAVLDWEMATIGDPLMDLGNNLCLWIEANDPEWMQAMRQQPTHLPGMMTRHEVIDYYLAKTGYQVDDFSWYYIWGMFRMAAILQQIYYRYYHGQSQDPRFAPFIGIIQMLEKRCESLML